MAYSRKLLISLFMLMLMSTSQAGVYKWIDENGKVHYGDKPSSAEADEVKIRKHSYKGSSDQPASRIELQERFLRARKEQRREKNESKAEEKKTRVEKKQKCARVKKDYAKYRSATGLYDLDKSGERKYLSFKDREKYEKSLEAKIKKWCGK